MESGALNGKGKPNHVGKVEINSEWRVGFGGLVSPIGTLSPKVRHGGKISLYNLEIVSEEGEIY